MKTVISEQNTTIKQLRGALASIQSRSTQLRQIASIADEIDDILQSNLNEWVCYDFLSLHSYFTILVLFLWNIKESSFLTKSESSDKNTIRSQAIIRGRTNLRQRVSNQCELFAFLCISCTLMLSPFEHSLFHIILLRKRYAFNTPMSFPLIALSLNSPSVPELQGNSEAWTIQSQSLFCIMRSQKTSSDTSNKEWWQRESF